MLVRRRVARLHVLVDWDDLAAGDPGTGVDVLDERVDLGDVVTADEVLRAKALAEVGGVLLGHHADVDLGSGEPARRHHVGRRRCPPCCAPTNGPAAGARCNTYRRRAANTSTAARRSRACIAGTG